jgi:hypothetical protein
MNPDMTSNGNLLDVSVNRQTSGESAIIEQLLLSNRKFNWHGRFYLYFNGINNIYDFLLH